MNEAFAWRRPRRNPRLRNGWRVAWLSLMTVGLYYVYWVYRLHAEAPERAGIDPSGLRAVGLPMALGIASLVPVMTSGIHGEQEVNLALFSIGMAINFASHVAYLRTTQLLTARLTALAGACGVNPARLLASRQHLFIGVLLIAVENVALKSIELLSLDVPPWIHSLDGVLLSIGTIGVVSWGRACLGVANAYYATEQRTTCVLGLSG